MGFELFVTVFHVLLASTHISSSRSHRLPTYAFSYTLIYTDHVVSIIYIIGKGYTSDEMGEKVYIYAITEQGYSLLPRVRYTFLERYKFKVHHGF